jgi:hypothetical protein
LLPHVYTAVKHAALQVLLFPHTVQNHRRPSRCYRFRQGETLYPTSGLLRLEAVMLRRFLQIGLKLAHFALQSTFSHY